jgi:hypothetical protein
MSSFGAVLSRREPGLSEKRCKRRCSCCPRPQLLPNLPTIPPRQLAGVWSRRRKLVERVPSRSFARRGSAAEPAAGERLDVLPLVKPRVRTCARGSRDSRTGIPTCGPRSARRWFAGGGAVSAVGSADARTALRKQGVAEAVAGSEVVAGCGPLDRPPDQSASAHSERGKHVFTTGAPHLACGSGSIVRLCLGQFPDPHVIRPPC